jgi:hypothetical protein
MVYIIENIIYPYVKPEVYMNTPADPSVDDGFRYREYYVWLGHWHLLYPEELDKARKLGYYI